MFGADAGEAPTREHKVFDASNEGMANTMQQRIKTAFSQLEPAALVMLEFSFTARECVGGGASLRP